MPGSTASSQSVFERHISWRMQRDLMVTGEIRPSRSDTRRTAQHLTFGVSFSVGVDSKTETVPFSVVEDTKSPLNWKKLVVKVHVSVDDIRGG